MTAANQSFVLGQRFYFIILATAVVAGLWVLLFYINDLLLPFFEHSILASWIFLPAFLRLAAVMVLGWRAISGLFVGSLITSELLHHEYTSEINLEIALLSSLVPWLAYAATRRMLNVNANLATLRPYHLLIFSATCSLTTAVAHSMLYTYHGIVDNFTGQFVPMVTGNFIGTVIVLYLIKSILNSERFQR